MANASASYDELSDLEGFVMSPGQDIPVAIEKTVIMLAVSASKIERGSVDCGLVQSLGAKVRLPCIFQKN